MRYCVESTGENVEQYKKKLEGSEDFELCRLGDPEEPVLVNKTRIYSHPSRYHMYQSILSLVANEQATPETETQLVNRVQVVQLLNQVFLSQACNSELYTLQRTAMKDVLNLTWKYSTLYDNKTADSFAKWCSHQHLDLFKVPPKGHNADDGDRQRVRNLFVLKSEYHANVVGAISTVLPRHQANIGH
ncbi:hypothetical protein BCR43DRAFT_312346 [Syncephalastrum racemosum]|uniref:Uncharacterized protein n=1 Tax=Syncephalastrum racemosum TaxID=13706 RepID=A0A1X2HC40_SYNRA|nr:hypothetical protein BCR43DRAFT_312346 [Syncephalastrum racemosum]